MTGITTRIESQIKAKFSKGTRDVIRNVALTILALLVARVAATAQEGSCGTAGLGCAAAEANSESESHGPVADEAPSIRGERDEEVTAIFGGADPVTVADAGTTAGSTDASNGNQ